METEEIKLSKLLSSKQFLKHLILFFLKSISDKENKGTSKELCPPSFYRININLSYKGLTYLLTHNHTINQLYFIEISRYAKEY